MKKFLILLIATIIFSCSDDDEPERLMYSITYSVVANNGATINKVEYLDENADRVELTNVTSPWSVNLRVRAGLALEAAAYGDVPFEGSLSITANWTPDGGATQSESQTLPNDTPNSVINNGKVEITGRTLPD